LTGFAHGLAGAARLRLVHRRLPQEGPQTGNYALERDR